MKISKLFENYEVVDPDNDGEAVEYKQPPFRKLSRAEQFSLQQSGKSVYQMFRPDRHSDNPPSWVYEVNIIADKLWNKYADDIRYVQQDKATQEEIDKLQAAIRNLAEVNIRRLIRQQYDEYSMSKNLYESFALEIEKQFYHKGFTIWLTDSNYWR